MSKKINNIKFENLTPDQMEAASIFLSDLRPKLSEAANIASAQKTSAEDKVEDAVKERKYDAEFLQASSLLVHSSDTYHKLCMLLSCIDTVTDADVVRWAIDGGEYYKAMNYVFSVLVDLGRDGLANRLLRIIRGW